MKVHRVGDRIVLDIQLVLLTAQPRFHISTVDTLAVVSKLDAVKTSIPWGT